jgi:GWxTD domain-containing protein
MERAFWINGDPDPTTDLNERFLEHVYRTFRADLFFSHSKVHVAWTRPQVRGWNTERGEVSIKFGWPDKIYATHGGDRQEHWTYVTPFQNHTFVFTDRFLNGNLQIPPDKSSKLVYARYENRVTSFKPSAVLIDGAVDAVAFKDDDLTSSVYVTAQINADSVLSSVDLASSRDWYVRTRFFDYDWMETHTDAETLGVADLPVVEGTEYRLFDFVSRHRMPFDSYVFAFTFEDNLSTVLATYNGQSDGSGLIGDALASSGVLLLREGRTGASFVRRDELLTANPWRTYAAGQPLRAYFEVYNLHLSEGRTRYRVTYEIHDHPDKPRTHWNRLGRWVTSIVGAGDGAPYVAQTFTRVGFDHDTSEKIAIDVDVLKGGRYRLIVTVEDINSGERTRVDKSFYKVGKTD